MNKRYIKWLLVFGLSGTAMQSANAGIPVIDAANLAQAVQQVIAWGQQYTQMTSQIQSMTSQLNAITGSRNILSALPNNQAVRQAFPVASLAAPFSPSAQLNANVTQSSAQLASATNRVAMLTSLINSIDGAADTKASADLANRIHAEQAFLANEATMLQAGKDAQAAQLALQALNNTNAGTAMVHGTVSPF